jgi:hypothetical protein
LSRAVQTCLLLIVAAALACVTAAAQSQRPGDGRSTPARTTTLADLDWLVGTWRGAHGATTVEERWTPPAGGAMLGLSRTIKGTQMVAFEFLRILERDGTLVYIAQPNGRPPVEFTMTVRRDGSATFENPMHDFPKMIAYTRRNDGSLRAVVSDGAQSQQTFEFNRAP